MPETATPSHPPAFLVRKLPWLKSPPLWWIGSLLWLATVFALSSISGPALPEGPEIPHLDKLVHAALYAAGAYSLATAVRLSFPRARAISLYPICAIAISAVGALDEFYQLHTPGRSGADPYDWLADAMGACLMLALLAATSRRPHRGASI